jgi:GNAT superfamily N-acetyltransferase
VAPLFSEEGINEFRSFIDPPRLRERLSPTSFILVAEIDIKMVGVIGVRDWGHVFLLFVKGDQQRKGIARSLLSEVLKRGRKARPDLERITVNSSPNAVEAYRRMGFIPTSGEQLTNGIRYVPMAMELSERGVILTGD